MILPGSISIFINVVHSDLYTGEGINEVKEALIRVGADEDFQGGTKGSFALLGYTGPEKVVWLKQVSKPRGQGPAKIITFVITPEGAERLSNFISI